MPELAGALAITWLWDQYQRSEEQRAEAAEDERAAFRRWQEAMAAYDAANDATADAWTVLRMATESATDDENP